MTKELNNLLKNFLKYKLHTLDKSKVKKEFNVLSLENNLLNSNSIDEIQEACRAIARGGLKQLTTISNALINFFAYIDKEKLTSKDIDTNLLDTYINKYCIDELSIGTRTNYKNNITAFFNYIDENYNHDTKYNIKKIKIIKKNEESSSLSLLDWIDTKTITFVNREILKYKYKNDFEKNRDILIFRLFCFSGMLPSEMQELTEDSFIINSDSMTLCVGTSDKYREIPLPKRKLIVYYNYYVKNRSRNAKTFFYSPTNNLEKIDKQILTYTVKKLLEFTKVAVRDMTPLMLRKSYLIMIKNEKDPITGLTQTEKNVQYLSGITNTTVFRELLKFHSIEVMNVTNVFDGLNI